MFDDSITVAIGDVHGELEKLRQLISRVEKVVLDDFSRSKNIKYVFIGDYIDRGPDSKGVIDFVRKMPNTVALIGNHETMLLEAAANADRYLQRQWMKTYGQTLKSFGVIDVSDFPQEYLTWMRGLEYFHNDWVRIFVHAGIQRDRPLSMTSQSKDYMTWARNEFLNDTRSEGGFVVHGHTPLPIGIPPDLHDNRVNIDTSACFGGVLSAVVFHGSIIKPIRYVQSNGVSGMYLID